MATTTVSIQFATNAALFADQMAKIVASANAAAKQTEAAGHAAKKAADEMKGAAEHAKGLGSAFQNMVVMAASFFAVERVKEWTHSLIEASSKFEQLKLSIAGSISGTGGASFAASQVIAEKRIEELMKAAKVQVGTNEDYFSVAKQLMAPGRAAHATSEEIVNLTTKLVPVILTTEGKEGVAQIGRQVSEVLTRGISPNLAPAIGRIIREAGMTFEQFNKIKTQDRIPALTRLLGGFSGMIKAGETSWEAASSTLESNLALLGRTAGESVFEFWKSTVNELNESMERNKGTIDSIALTAGAIAKGGFSLMVDSLKWVVENGEAITGVMSVIASAGAAYAGFSALSGIITLVGEFAAVLAVAGAPMIALAAAAAAAVVAIGLIVKELAKMAGDDARIGRIAAEQKAKAAKFTEGAYAIGAKGHLGAGIDRYEVATDDFFKKNGAGQYADTLYKVAKEVGSQKVADQYWGKYHTASDPGLIAERAKLKKMLDNPAEARMHQSKAAEVNVKITMDVRDVRDPDRLASITAKKLAEFVKAPTQGRRALPVGGF
jgi:hypothetical protein